MIYTDRNGTWWYRYERNGIRVWASGDDRSPIDMPYELAFESAMSAHWQLEEKGERGDFVVRPSGDIVRRAPGESPYGERR